MSEPAQKPYTVNPSYRVKYTWDVSANTVVAMDVETSVPLSLYQVGNLPEDQNPLLIPETANVTLQGDEVSLVGPIRTPGRKITISARVLKVRRSPRSDETPPAIVVPEPVLIQNDESKIPAQGRNQVVVAALGDVLRFRVFDGEGRLALEADTNSPGVSGQTQDIELLRARLKPLWLRPQQLTPDEKAHVVREVYELIGYTPPARLADLDVSGAPLSQSDAHPPALVKGLAPNTSKLKILKGEKGPDGSTAIFPGTSWSSVHDGVAGDSAATAALADRMNGEPGNEGHGGNGAGSISLFCDEIRSEFGRFHLRLIPAVGDPGTAPVDGNTPQDLNAGPMLSIPQVLVAGRWKTADEVARMSAGDRRAALVAALAGLNKEGEAPLNGMSDDDLAGRGGVTAFLLAVGSRDAAGLRAGLLEDHRNTLIVENGRTGRKDLQAINNHAQVRLGLTWAHLDAAARALFLVDVTDDGNTPQNPSAGPMLSIPQVLVAGRWKTADEVAQMSAADRRAALVAALAGLNKEGEDPLNGMSDDDLAGRGGVTAFLLAVGSRDAAGLRAGLLEDHRNTLIVENGRTGRKDLQALNNHAQVRLGLTWAHLDAAAKVLFLVDVTSRGWRGVQRCSKENLTKRGESLVAVAALDSGPLAFRIFDEFGRLVVDTDERRVRGENTFDNLIPKEVRAIEQLRDRLVAVWSENVTLTPEVEAELIAAVMAIVGYRKDNRSLVLRADGGPGGDGQPGQEGADGGDGGKGAAAKGRAGIGEAGWCPPTNGGAGGDGGKGGKGGRAGGGGDGGKVFVYCARGGANVGSSVAKGVPGARGAGGEGGKKGTPGDAGEPVRDYVELEYMIIPVLDTVVSRPHDDNYYRMKNGGSRGAEGKDGDRGDPGDAAEPALDGSFASGTGATVPEGLSVPATASFLQIFYERFRARYLVTNPLDARRFDALKAMFAWLQRIKDLVPADNPVNAPLMKALNASIWSSQVNLEHDRDYFGKDPLWVPLLSLDTFTTSLQQAIDTLKLLEPAANSYYDSLSEKQGAASNQGVALTSADQVITRLEGMKSATTTEIDNVLRELKKIEDQRPADRRALAASLERFGKQVESAFGLTWTTFFNALSQLAFTDDKSNVKAGMMVASQLGSMIEEAATNVLTDTGDRVKKPYLLKEIKALSGDNLKEQLTGLQGGFISDASSYSVLVSYAKFRGLVENFRASVPEAAGLIGQLETYIDHLRQRNRQVDYYNELLQRLFDIQGEINKTTHQKKVVEGKLSAAQDPGRPELTASVAGLLEGAKSNCLTDLYLAYRAYGFWALKPFDGFADLIGGESAGPVSAYQLEKAKGDLKQMMLDALQEHAKEPNPFPGLGSDADSMGRLVVLTRQTHPEIFQDLEDNLWADFEIEPATRASFAPAHDFEPTTAAWSLSNDPPESPSPTHPFHGLGDVRLTRARPWMVGMVTSTGKHDVYLFHLEQERFITDKDNPFPAEDPQDPGPRYFTHDPIPFHFVYEARGLKYDPATKSLTTGEIFKHVIGTEDANIGLPDKSRVGLPEKVRYAPIGPFGRWRIRLRPEDNAGASALQLTSWGDGSGVPTSGNNLVIAGTDGDGLLHIRTFDAAGVRTDTFENRDTSSKELQLVTADASGAVLWRTPKSSLPTTQADAITTLENKLPGWLPPRDLDRVQRDQILKVVASITGLTHLGMSLEKLEMIVIDFQGFARPNVES